MISISINEFHDAMKEAYKAGYFSEDTISTDGSFEVWWEDNRARLYEGKLAKASLRERSP